MQAYVHTKQVRADGALDSLATIAVDVKTSELERQKLGLSYTRSGYGKRIPTAYMVRFNGRWRRVYCAVFSNTGTLYIGRFGAGESSVHTVSIHE